ncbi:hypothetical protein ACFLTK_05330 [Chloroflexota bacterium]
MQIAPQAATFNDSAFPRIVGTLNLLLDAFSNEFERPDAVKQHCEIVNRNLGKKSLWQLTREYDVSREAIRRTINIQSAQ